MKPKQWTVESRAHAGEISVDFLPVPPGMIVNPGPIPPGNIPSAAAPGMYQTIYFASPPSQILERHFVTVENDGPASMKLWVDFPYDNPEAAQQPPALVLLKNQSCTISASHNILVRPGGPPGVKGNYVASWCCATVLGGPIPHAQKAE